MNDPVLVATGQSDADRAVRIRSDLTPLLDHVCEIITTARRSGLVVNFNLSPDPTGRHRIMMLDVSKPL